MDGGAWWASVHGVAKSQTRLSDFTSTFHFHALDKEMATHSSVLAWRIPGTGEPGGLPSVGSHRVGHDWRDLAAAAAAAAAAAGSFPGGANGKEFACQCRRFRFDHWFRKIPWRRAWQPIQYSCLEDPMDRGAWWATGYRVSVVSDSVRPHRRQPTRLPCPWDSPGKNTGVGCYCLLQFLILFE